MTEKKTTGKDGISFWIWTIVTSALVIGTVSFYYRYTTKTYSKLEERGQFGDMFGGLNPLFSGLALVGVVASLLYQKKELTNQITEIKISNEEFNKQNKILIEQNLQNNFFKLLDFKVKLYETVSDYDNESRKTVYGFPAMDLLKKTMKEKFHQFVHNNALGGDAEKADLVAFSKGYFAHPNTTLKSYLIHIMEVFEYLVRLKVDNLEFYSNLLRAQLNDMDLAHLFYFLLASNNSQVNSFIADKKIFEMFHTGFLLHPYHKNTLTEKFKIPAP